MIHGCAFVTVKCQSLNSNVIRIIETGIFIFKYFSPGCQSFFMKRSYNLN